MTKEKTTNEEEYDICVSCGKVTSYKKTDHTDFRYGYIEGAGHSVLFAVKPKNCTRQVVMIKIQNLLGTDKIGEKWIKL